MGAHLFSFFLDLSFFVSGKNEVLLAWEFNFRKFRLFSIFHVFWKQVFYLHGSSIFKVFLIFSMF